MPTWAWPVVFIFVIFMLTMHVTTYNLELEKRAPSSITHTYSKQGPGNKVFVLIPGILARSEQQFEPLFQTFLKYGSVDALSYVGHGFNLDQVARSVAKVVDEHIKNGKNVVLVGASLGGLVANHSLSYVIYANPLNLEIIMIDSPYGVETMKAFPEKLAFLTKLYPGAPIPNVIGNRLLESMQELPKREYVDFPKGVNPESYYKNISKEAKRYLSHHNFSSWWRQLVAMVNVKPSRHPKYVITYIVSVGDANDVVSQPLASKRWKSLYPNMTVFKLSSAHCGFLQQKLRWETMFNTILSQ